MRRVLDHAGVKQHDAGCEQCRDVLDHTGLDQPRYVLDYAAMLNQNWDTSSLGYPYHKVVQLAETGAL